ncbi:hypothetical protein CFC21_091606 [Triticum aestivum]|uniref:Pentatricopeptide repeat-containing protein n=2 Tax=Triticum aestivum TaxID=4565 RepID=A0A9R1LGS6_WHEAT|nr:pentatricopeptide repeat-containing protein At1g06580-like [Triticum aestivum]KAF7088503.1 hypothetical protein CFC21_091606 [Triticum aestivum]
MPRARPGSSSSSVSSRADQLLNKLKDHLGPRTLQPERAHQLFDKLLRQTVPVSAFALNGLFAVLARALPSAACTDGPALAIALFNRMNREGHQVIAPTNHAYNILIDCCCRSRFPGLGPAFFGRLLKTGIKANIITFHSLFKCQCDIKQMEEALNRLLYRIPELPDSISYSIIIKSLCDNGRSQCALDLLRMKAKKGADHYPEVVAYNREEPMA